MDYQRHYDRLVETRRNRHLSDGTYYERHHIVPKSMGGSHDETNIVILTFREHFLAHWLLYKIFPKDYRVICAFWSMCNFKNRGQSKFRTSSRSYAEARTAFRNSKSEKMAGNKFCLGYKHSEVTKKKMSIAKSNMTIENRINIGKSRIGHAVSEITRSRIGIKNRISQRGNLNAKGTKHNTESVAARIKKQVETCRLKRLEKTVTIKCELCEHDFMTTNKNRRFCSKKCSNRRKRHDRYP